MVASRSGKCTCRPERVTRGGGVGICAADDGGSKVGVCGIGVIDSR